MTNTGTYQLGMRENLGLFTHQLFQVLLVGMTIGLERTVLPVLAEQEFGVARGSFTLLFAFVVSFGFVKGAMNFISGRLSETQGRRRVLVMGWLAALPIPFMILYAPSWNWIIAANILLGINQGFAWSMTVTAKMDIIRPTQRGMATGMNEFAGYTGVALAGLATSYAASFFAPRTSLFIFGLTIILVALAHAWFIFGETLPFARAEAARHKAAPNTATHQRFAKGLSDHPTALQVFRLVSYRNRDFMALSQAGHVEKYIDTAMWVLVPVYLHLAGASLIQIGWITGIYGVVWGASQLWTGPLSDRVGRKWPAVAGMWISALGAVLLPQFSTVTGWSFSAALTGVGMALLYPTLIAAVSDISHPNWRGSSLGVYRFWRDLGYGVGALAMGFLVQSTGQITVGFWFTGGAMALSGLWLALGLTETHPNIHSNKEGIFQ